MKNPWARAVLMSAVLVLGASAASAETNFPATVQLGGQTLVKNGQGTRYRAVFKVYDMALYLPSRTQDAAQVLAMPGAKRASFVALRDIPGISSACRWSVACAKTSIRNTRPRWCAT